MISHFAKKYFVGKLILLQTVLTLNKQPIKTIFRIYCQFSTLQYNKIIQKGLKQPSNFQKTTLRLLNYLYKPPLNYYKPSKTYSTAKKLTMIQNSQFKQFSKNQNLSLKTIKILYNKFSILKIISICHNFAKALFFSQKKLKIQKELHLFQTLFLPKMIFFQTNFHNQVLLRLYRMQLISILKVIQVQILLK
ncbi:hypothetical protein IMG5_035220 [Ichthyophthirius multifiliis]|uniref:Transmembrane protein n=1 Tax=Ichthyophthirius multifiliis TaxID=5932 RepID=G0QLR7_ICHMU|nr:hypothetical protein IMG5_035220 [Ichthyophthirius multifiliis]EGR33837.1 hypothetical protein IMG5_035220 [Ichthyophthirius multifiliis]|eukprot:XP_004039061.1 hypothetical protein IMG5_035220 [Ichthyophthirius multifiliis]